MYGGNGTAPAYPHREVANAKDRQEGPLLLFIALVAVTAGIPSVASAQASGGPSVTMSLLSPTAQVRTGSPLPVRAAFSEPVSGFTGSGGDTVYTFDVIPDSIGTVTVEIAAGAAEDAAGGGNEAAPLLSLGIPYDDDDDGDISRNEAIAAITDYFADRLARDEVLGVITPYFASVGPAAPVSMTLAAGAGDSVEHGSGAQIEIPPDTTAEAATVTIAEVDPPESPVAVGRGLRLLRCRRRWAGRRATAARDHHPAVPPAEGKDGRGHRGAGLEP